MPHTVIDIHVLQTVPPSCVNRDDTGSPKTAFYGGVRRARVSSQAWKRATRQSFKSSPELDSRQLGVRTKRLVELVVKALEGTPDLTPAQAAAAATTVLEAGGFKLDKPRPRKAKGEEATDADDPWAQSQYLFFLSARQIERLAELSLQAHGDGKPARQEVRDALNAEQSIDVALFGRMVADDKTINVDAAAQVAHALSVHAVDNEFDYFTAVDDRSPEDSAGAGMIGTVEFNSSTLYRYATVDLGGLKHNLSGAGDANLATAQAVQAFVRAFVTSMPTGKQNTFANRTLPDAVVVMVRESQPVNLVGAFEDAVVAAQGGSGRLAAAVQRLTDYALSTDATFGGAALSTWVVERGAPNTAPLRRLGESTTLDGLISAVGSAVSEALAVPSGASV